VQLDELACDRETQSGAVMLSRRTRIDLRELTKHEVVMLGVDADAGVADFHHALRAVGPFDASGMHPHMPTARREVDRVAEQVPDDVRHLLAIGSHEVELGGNYGDEVESLLAGERLVQRVEL